MIFIIFIHWIGLGLCQGEGMCYWIYVINKLLSQLCGNDEHNRCWSIYWQPGMEWWGCFAFTTYNIEKGVFVIATASESD